MLSKTSYLTWKCAYETIYLVTKFTNLLTHTQTYYSHKTLQHTILSSFYFCSEAFINVMGFLCIKLYSLTFEINVNISMTNDHLLYLYSNLLTGTLWCNNSFALTSMALYWKGLKNSIKLSLENQIDSVVVIVFLKLLSKIP